MQIDYIFDKVTVSINGSALRVFKNKEHGLNIGGWNISVRHVEHIRLSYKEDINSYSKEKIITSYSIDLLYRGPFSKGEESHNICDNYEKYAANYQEFLIKRNENIGKALELESALFHWVGSALER